MSKEFSVSPFLKHRKDMPLSSIPLTDITISIYKPMEKGYASGMTTEAALYFFFFFSEEVTAWKIHL